MGRERGERQRQSGGKERDRGRGREYLEQAPCPARGSEITSKRVRIQGHSLGEEGGATLVSTLGIQYSMASAVRWGGGLGGFCWTYFHSFFRTWKRMSCSSCYYLWNASDVLDSVPFTSPGLPYLLEPFLSSFEVWLLKITQVITEVRMRNWYLSQNSRAFLPVSSWICPESWLFQVIGSEAFINYP